MTRLNLIKMCLSLQNKKNYEIEHILSNTADHFIPRVKHQILPHKTNKIIHTPEKT